MSRKVVNIINKLQYVILAKIGKNFIYKICYLTESCCGKNYD